MNQERCDICGIDFKGIRCYKAHLKSIKHKNILDNKQKYNYKCVCGKSYMNRQSLYVHKKSCLYKEENPIEVKTLIKENHEIKEENNKMRERLDKKDQEMEELRKKVEMLIERKECTVYNGKGDTYNGDQTNIGNQYIVVNSLGNENIEHLTDQIICKLIKTAPFTCVLQLIEKIHFDPEHPENHNIKLTNKKTNYAEIVRNKKWVTANKKQVIDDVIQNSYYIIDEKYVENKKSISEKVQERFENFQEKYENDDKEIHRNIKNDVDLIIINGTNEVHK